MTTQLHPRESWKGGDEGRKLFQWKGEKKYQFGTYSLKEIGRFSFFFGVRGRGLSEVVIFLVFFVTVRVSLIFRKKRV